MFVVLDAATLFLEDATAITPFKTGDSVLLHLVMLMHYQRYLVYYYCSLALHSGSWGMGEPSLTL